MELIRQNISQIQSLCKHYHVARLSVFSSIVTPRFNKNSDIDFVVYFDAVPLLDYADNFFDFMHGLEDVLHRRIDLVSGKAMKNPFFIEEVSSVALFLKDNQLIKRFVF